MRGLNWDWIIYVRRLIISHPGPTSRFGQKSSHRELFGSSRGVWLRKENQTQSRWRKQTTTQPRHATLAAFNSITPPHVSVYSDNPQALKLQCGSCVYVDVWLKSQRLFKQVKEIKDSYIWVWSSYITLTHSLGINDIPKKKKITHPYLQINSS